MSPGLCVCCSCIPSKCLCGSHGLTVNSLSSLFANASELVFGVAGLDIPLLMLQLSVLPLTCLLAES